MRAHNLETASSGSSDFWKPALAIDTTIDSMFTCHQSNIALTASLVREQQVLSITSIGELFGRLIIDRLSSREVLAISLLVLVLISLILLIR